MSNFDEIVHPGACFVGDELIRCALFEESCTGMAYMSHRQLQGTKHAQKCAGSFSNHERGDHIGMCTTDKEDFLCTGHESNCALPYVEHMPYCSLQYNHFPQRDFPFALYGRCIPRNLDNNVGQDRISREGTCVWSSESCTDDTYVPAAEQLLLAQQGDRSYDDVCTCDKVKVGACLHSVANYYACAVSADACDVESHFHSWDRVQASGHDCRLCDVFDKSAEVKTFSSIDNTCRAGAAGVGGLVGGILLSALVCLLVLYRRHNKANFIFDGIFRMEGGNSSVKEIYPDNLQHTRESDPPEESAVHGTNEMRQPSPTSVRTLRSSSPTYSDEDMTQISLNEF